MVSPTHCKLLKRYHNYHLISKRKVKSKLPRSSDKLMSDALPEYELVTVSKRAKDEDTASTKRQYIFTGETRKFHPKVYSNHVVMNNHSTRSREKCYCIK